MNRFRTRAAGLRRGRRRGRPRPALEGAPPAEVSPAGAATILGAAARHPWLRWPDLTDVAPALASSTRPSPTGSSGSPRARSRPCPVRSSVAASTERGLDPADYDAERLAAEPRPTLGRRRRGAGARAVRRRAHGVRGYARSAAVHHGRVDPRTLGWGYDPPRGNDGPPRASCGTCGRAACPRSWTRSSPRTPTIGATSASWPATACWPRAATEALVPALAKPRRKVAPGQSWDGTARLALAPPRPGRPGRRDELGRRRYTRPRPGDGGGAEALPGPPHPRRGRRRRPGHDRGPQRPAGAARAPARAGPRARALAAAHHRPSDRLRQRPASSGCGPPTRREARSRCA